MVENGYCPKHRTADSRFRGNSTERGYDRPWRALRNHFIKMRCEPCGDDPSVMCQQCAGTGLPNAFCAECLAGGRLQQTQEVDHIIPWLDNPALKRDLRNLQGLCSHHHSLKTRAEDFGTELSPFQRLQKSIVSQRLLE